MKRLSTERLLTLNPLLLLPHMCKSLYCIISLLDFRFYPFKICFDWTNSCPISINKCFNVVTVIQYSKHQSREYTFSYLLQWNYNKFTSYFILVFTSGGGRECIRKSSLSENSPWSFIFWPEVINILFPNNAIFYLKVKVSNL